MAEDKIAKKLLKKERQIIAEEPNTSLEVVNLKNQQFEIKPQIEPAEKATILLLGDEELKITQQVIKTIQIFISKCYNTSSIENN